MKDKIFMHVKTEKLLILYPKDSQLEIKSDFCKQFFLPKNDFIIIYAIAYAYPYSLSHTELISLLSDFGLELHSYSELKERFLSAKDALKNWGIKDFMHTSRGKRYAISRHWITPVESSDKSDDAFLKSLKHAIAKLI